MNKFFRISELDTLLEIITECEGHEAAEWVRQTIDPHHHKLEGRTPVGAPSRTNEPVLVFADTFSFPVKIPSGFDPTQSWSYVVQIFDDMVPSVYQRYNRDNNVIIFNPAAGSSTYGGVTVYAFQNNSGSAQWSDLAVTPVKQIGLNNTLVTTKNRTTGLSVVIYDVTNELNKQGTCTAGRHNEGSGSDTTNYFLTTAAGDRHGSADVVEEFSYPDSSSQLANFPGFAKHEAKLGAYSVAVVDPFVEASVPDFTHRIFESLLNVSPPNTHDVTFPELRASTAAADVLTPVYTNSRCGIKPMQIWFEGLHSSASHSFTIQMISEGSFAPNVPGQGSLLPLLRKATPWCPKAMAVVGILTREMAGTYLASDNSFGSFLRKAVSTAGPDLADALGSIPHPYAQAGSFFLNAMNGLSQPRNVPAVLALPVNSNAPNGVQLNTTLSRPTRRNNPKRSGITTPLVPQQQMGIFPPMQTLGSRRTNRSARTTQPRSIMTNYQRMTAAPVTAKTLKNRKKRDKKKLRAAGFPTGGYTITM